MLGQRVITAVVLLALLLPALFASATWPFAVLTLAFIVAAGWEWARLNGATGAVPWALAAGTGLLAVGLAFAASPGDVCRSCDVGAVSWAVGGLLALRLGPAGWSRIPKAARLAVGPLLLAVAWLALTRAHAAGINFLLSVMCLVWVADIAAYAGGRMLGRHKLAPTISPGKTWEGAVSGVLGVLLLGVGWWLADRHFGVAVPGLSSVLVARFGIPGALALLVLLAGASVVGDLFESLVKRAAGAKDSSGLLPGHGGVLDRIDALLPVFPLVAVLALR
jgi:phosphatidate cytidylyltransferase